MKIELEGWLYGLLVTLKGQVEILFYLLYICLTKGLSILRALSRLQKTVSSAFKFKSVTNWEYLTTK